MTEKLTNEDVQRALGTFVKMVRAVDTVTSRVHRHLAPLGLTVSQFGVLEALYHLGPLNQREIGRKILKSSGNITVVLGNLERRNLIRRTRLEQDRRHVSVELTDSGREAISSLFPLHAAEIVREMSVLTANEQNELARLCRKLGLAGPLEAKSGHPE